VHHSLLALALTFASAVASTQDLLSSCTAIDEDMVRLRCYDASLIWLCHALQKQRA
jgi:hypothetical protein